MAGVSWLNCENAPPTRASQGNKLGKANANSCSSPSRYEIERRGKELTDLGVQLHFFFFFLLVGVLYLTTVASFCLFYYDQNRQFHLANSNNGEVLSAAVATRFSTGLRLSDFPARSALSGRILSRGTSNDTAYTEHGLHESNENSPEKLESSSAVALHPNR